MTPPTRLLIVDDDPDIRETLHTFLESEGYVVDEAANGREALDRLHEAAAAPCIILLDLMMPVMDGWEFCRRKRQDAALADIPVLVVTAASDADPAALGAADVLRKPVDVDVLLASIARNC